MSKQEYLEMLFRVKSEVDNFIDESEIYHDHKIKLRKFMMTFSEEAIASWNYSHPNEEKD